MDLDPQHCCSLSLSLKELGRVDVCINNAGMSTAETLSEGSMDSWRKMLNINVLGQQQIKPVLRTPPPLAATALPLSPHFFELLFTVSSNITF